MSKKTKGEIKNKKDEKIKRLKERIRELEKSEIKYKQAEKFLQESEERLSLTLESAGLGLWDQNFKTNKIIRNERWAEMLGYELKDIDSNVEFWKNLIHPDDITKVEDIVKDHELGKTEHFEIEHRMKTKTGDWKWILNWGKIVSRNKDGSPVRALGTHFNITERKKLEEALKESKEQFSAIVEHSHNGILIVGKDYKFIYVNDRLCEILSYTREEIIGHDFKEFLDEESRKLVAERYIRRQRREIVPSRYEFNIVRKDGKKRHVEISSTVIKDSKGKIKTIAQILDITERKKAEESLKKHRDHLEELVKERTKELEEKNKELKRFNKLFVGREFRIKELKDKIKDIERKKEMSTS